MQRYTEVQDKEFRQPNAARHFFASRVFGGLINAVSQSIEMQSLVSRYRVD
ncbi:MAG: hypothetical protein AAF665_03775 [Pseudomonadota bacterium]